ncbi:MAG: TM1812 family CRISPR-associated protein [Candidatus Cloacimonetes bacterium]|nr:TM1812 family CRISPR-associated protein [Candidatus Cloacimonadota bacterium]
MPKVLISFLGTGPYKACRYAVQAQLSQKTAYVQVAECELYQIDRAVILCTSKSLELHWQPLREQLAANGVSASYRDMPDCSSPQEFWDLFKILQSVISEYDGHQIYLDITHSFRAIPFFAGSVVSFQRMVSPTKSQIQQIFYGEGPQHPKNPETAEVLKIWDLSPFLELLDWSQALSQFLETGNASKLGALTTEHATEEIKSANQNQDFARRNTFNSLKSLGKGLTEISLGLAGNRTGELLVDRAKTRCSVARALENLDKCREIVASDLPPLALLLHEIQSMLEPMSQGFVHGQSGVKSWLQLAKLYLKFGRYADCSATLREGLLNIKIDPAHLFSEKERHSSALGVLAKTIFDLRNDLNHAGYRSNPSKTEVIQSNLEDFIQKIEDSIFAPVFVNLSNHPSDKWSEAQTRAVMAVPCPFAAIAKIVDVNFPAVDPADDTPDLAKIAEKIIHDLPPGTVAALVQGEYILSTLIVQGLQALSIDCYTATTHRNVIDLPDGKKLTEFKFERLRKYPGLR